MSKVSLFLAVLALAATGLCVGIWFSQPADLSERVQQLENELKEARATIANLKSIAKAHSSVTDTRSRSDAMTRGGNAVPPAPPLSGAGPTSDSSAPAAAPEPVASAPMDPETMKNMAEAEARYAGLISQFNLSAADKEYFKQLAVQRNQVSKDLAIKLQDPTLTPQQREAAYAEARQAMDASDKAVREFLNNDSDFGKFLFWDQAALERAQLEAGRSVFSKSTPLSSDQENWLLGSLYQMRAEAGKAQMDPFNLEAAAKMRIDQQYIASVLARHDKDTEVLVQNARSKFSQPQLDALRQFRTQQRVALESRLWAMSRTSGGN